MILALTIWPGRVSEDDSEAFSRTGSIVPGGTAVSCAGALAAVSTLASSAALTIQPKAAATERKFVRFTIFSFTHFAKSRRNCLKLFPLNQLAWIFPRCFVGATT